MKSLARFAYRRRWLILALWIVLFLGMNALSQSFGTAYANTFTLPGTNSTHALSLLQSGFKSKSGDVDEIVFQAKSGTIASHRKAILAMDKKVAKVPSVASVVSPFVGGSLQISPNGKIAYSVVYFKTQGYKLKSAQIQPVDERRHHRALVDRSTSNSPGTPSSSSPRKRAAPDVDLRTDPHRHRPRARLRLALRDAVAPGRRRSSPSASRPRRRHCSATGSPSPPSRPFSGSLIGLGVGIDYALFIVTRTRQGLKRGLSPEDAVVTAINTSGRAVLFAGSTVCIALLGMLVLQLSFLNGVAIAASLDGA